MTPLRPPERAQPAARRAPWSPSPFLNLSLTVHAGAAASLFVAPSDWPLALGAVAANHIGLALAGLLPRCALLGPNLVRLPPAAAARGEVALTIDDGPDPEVTPQVLAILAAARARATFFCIGERAAAHPELLRAIAAAGHAVENHSEHHRHHFSLLGPTAMEREIGLAQQRLAALCGTAPSFFRAPAGLRNPFLEPLLVRHGLRLASWSRRAYDTRTGDPPRVLQRLGKGLAAGDILLLHDGNAARGPHGKAVIIDVLPPLLARIQALGLSTVTLAAACA